MCRCAVGLQLRVWRRSACFPSCRVALFRYRSFAFTARLVMRCGSDCPVPCDLSWLLDCLGSSVARFLLKRFNGFDVPVSRSSESHPSFRAICLRLALRSVLRPALRLAFLSSVRPVLPRDDVIAALPDRFSVPFDLRSSIAPPCLSGGWERDGTSLPRHRLPALPPLLACSGRVAPASVPIAAVCSACFGAAVCVCIVMAKLYI